MKQFFDSPDKALLIFILTLLSTAYLIGAHWWLTLAMIPILAVAIRFTNIYTVNLSVFILLTFLGPRLLPSQPPFIVIKLTGVFLFGICVLLVKPLRKSQAWFQVGHLNKSTFLYIAAIILISAVSLISWTFIASPNLQGYKRLLPEMPAQFIFLYIFLFAIINAAIEEIMWRGVMLTAFDRAFGAGLFSIFAQALSFGVAHFHGPFLYGWLGVALTTIFGILVGLLRQQSQGIAAPWAAHAASDFVILCLVYYFTLHSPTSN